MRRAAWNRLAQAYYPCLNTGMDTALDLRIKHDNGTILTEDEIAHALEKSALIKKITATVPEDAFALIWKLIALSEIPFSNRLEYTRNLAQIVIDRLGNPEGFSYSGKPAELLPCYNAMLIKALCKLGYASEAAVQSGVRWILRYQSFRRGFVTEWDEPEIYKHGGCLRSTPCYIGLAKSVYALFEYNRHDPDVRIAAKIEEGLDYILGHSVYRRLSNGEPITKHILDLCFPESYNVTIVELLTLLSDAGRLGDERVAQSIDYIESKRNASGKWGVGYAYGGDGYVSFDGKSRNAEWISYILNGILTRCRS
jgi:hypothetical protein